MCVQNTASLSDKLFLHLKSLAVETQTQTLNDRARITYEAIIVFKELPGDDSGLAGPE